MSWFYCFVKNDMSLKGWSFFLENKYTLPGEIYVSGGGCDAIALPPNANKKDIYYMIEIKSYDESPSNWLSHPQDEKDNNPKLFKVRNYWRDMSKEKSFSKEILGWGFAITGQLQKCFNNKPVLKLKKHKSLPCNKTCPTIPILPTQKKRMLIYDSSQHEFVVKSLELIGFESSEFISNEEIPVSSQYNWLTYRTLEFDMPKNTKALWF